MNISYLLTNHDKSLQFRKIHDTISVSSTREEQRDADYDGQTIIDCGGYRQDTWQISRHRNAPLSQKGNSRLQNWWTVVHQGRRLATILGGAQTEVVSPDINVKSHCRYRLDNFLRQWLRKTVQGFTCTDVSFVLIITTFRSFSKHEGGKCVVL